MKILARRSTSNSYESVQGNTRRTNSEISNNGQRTERSTGRFNSISRRTSRSLSPTPTKIQRQKSSAMAMRDTSNSLNSLHDARTLLQYQKKMSNWQSEGNVDNLSIQQLNIPRAPSPIKVNQSDDIIPQTSELSSGETQLAGFFASQNQDDDESNYTNNDVAIENEDDNASVATQESEIHHSRKRMTALVWKRKSGLRGKIKSSYVMASDTASTLTCKAKSNFSYHTMKNKLHAVGGGRKEKEKDTIVVDATVGGIGWNDGQIQRQRDRQYDRIEGGPTVVNGKDNHEKVQVKIWERRQLVLEGRLLMYYHEKAGLDYEDHDEDGERNSSKMLESICGEHQQLNSSPKLNQPLARRLKHNLMELVHTAHLLPSTINHGFVSPKLNVNTPRGVIDIIESKVTASVLPVGSHMNSYAAPPTPYNLAISVKSEIKWVFSFENPKELIKWLNIFADIALDESAKEYRKKHGKSYGERRVVQGKEGVEFGIQQGHVGNNWGGVENMVSGRNVSNDAWCDNAENINSSFTTLVGIDTPSSLSSRCPTRAPSRSPMFAKHAYQVFILFNSSFLYLLITMEEALAMPITLVFLLINVCAFANVCGKFGKRWKSKKGGLHKNGTLEREFLSARCVPSNQKPTELEEIPSFTERTTSEEFESVSEERQHKPLAGSTCVRLRNAYDDIHEENEPKVAWLPADPSIIHLRGPNYLTTRQKNPSPGSLYVLKEMDVFYANQHITNVGGRFKLPKNEFINEDHHWCAPDTLIISFSLPTTAPKLGRAATSADRKGLVVCGYYQIKPEVRKALAIVSNSNLSRDERDHQMNQLFPERDQRLRVNGILLWDKWCSTSGSDPEMQKRLKFIPRGENIKDLGVPSWICRYNGKPMLIKRPGETSFIFSHPNKRLLEIDVNLHPLPYMFKQAMAYLSDHYFARMMMTFGFVIEGRADEELPEVLLGDPITLPFNDMTKIPQSSAIFGDK